MIARIIAALTGARVRRASRAALRYRAYQLVTADKKATHRN